MARGARIIEKHFTMDKNMHGPDHSSSMDPDELKQLAKYASIIEKCYKEEYITWAEDQRKIS